MRHEKSFDTNAQQKQLQLLLEEKRLNKVKYIFGSSKNCNEHRKLSELLLKTIESIRTIKYVHSNLYKNCENEIELKRKRQRGNFTVISPNHIR